MRLPRLVLLASFAVASITPAIALASPACVPIGSCVCPEEGQGTAKTAFIGELVTPGTETEGATVRVTNLAVREGAETDITEGATLTLSPGVAGNVGDRFLMTADDLADSVEFRSGVADGNLECPALNIAVRAEDAPAIAVAADCLEQLEERGGEDLEDCDDGRGCGCSMVSKVVIAGSTPGLLVLAALAFASIKRRLGPSRAGR